MTSITPTDRRAPAPATAAQIVAGTRLQYDEVLAAFRACAGALPPVIDADPEAACHEDPAATYQAEGRDSRTEEILRLAIEMADEMARSDIECACAKVVSGTGTKTGHSGAEWYEMESARSEDVDAVARAFRYLELRGPVAIGYRVIHNPAFPSLIRFEDVERACRACGCTDHRACEGGCSWVAADLCSACQEKGA